MVTGTMFEKLRSKAYGALASTAGDRLAPVRLAKGALRYANDVAGRPLATEEEFAERAAFEQKLAAGEVGNTDALREPAPVVIFHRGKYKRDVAKMTEFLDTRKIPYQVRDIDGDEPTMEAVKREAGGYGLPVAFIAGEPIGRAQQLINLDAAGQLTKKVFG